MTATQNAPMKKNFSQVQKSIFIENYAVKKTQDYSLFSFLKGNRKTNAIHIKRLKDSMSRNYLVSPILVNEKMQIIDGQHRYLAAKDLSLPLYYLVVSGYGLKEVHIYNSNSSNYKKEDYLKGYCDLGIPEYITFQKFMQDFPDFGMQSSERIITQLKTGGKFGTFEGKGLSMKSFENGELKIPDIKKSYDIAEKILLIKPFYSNFHRGTFVTAMLGIFENPSYNHDEFINKLMQQPTALQDCTTTLTYRLLVEEIYNYRRREKVNLRF